jgi:hypothetical protein
MLSGNDRREMNMLLIAMQPLDPRVDVGQADPSMAPRRPDGTDQGHAT